MRIFSCVWRVTYLYFHFVSCLLYPLSIFLLGCWLFCFILFYFIFLGSESVNRLVVSNCLWPHGLEPARLLCPWASPGKNTGVGCHFLLQGIFLTQGSNSGSPALQADSLPPEPPGKPIFLGISALLESSAICQWYELQTVFPSLSFAFCLYGVFKIVVTVYLHLGHFETMMYWQDKFWIFYVGFYNQIHKRA